MSTIVPFPWVVPPDGFEPFDDTVIVATPGILSAELDVLTIKVPAGYDGIVKDLHHAVTGAFDEGSGDLVWRLRIDQRYLRSYGNMKVQFGDRTTPRASYGIVVRGGQKIVYSVVNLNYGVGATKIICNLRGYFYPKQNT